VYTPIDEDRVKNHLRNRSSSFGTLYPYVHASEGGRSYGATVYIRYRMAEAQYQRLERGTHGDYSALYRLKQTVQSRAAGLLMPNHSQFVSLHLVGGPGSGKTRALKEIVDHVPQIAQLNMDSNSTYGATGVNGRFTNALIYFGEDPSVGAGGGPAGGGNSGKDKRGGGGGGGTADKEAARTELYNTTLKMMDGEIMDRNTMSIVEGVRAAALVRVSFAGSAVVAVGNFQGPDPTTSAMGNRKDPLLFMRYVSAENPVTLSLGARGGTSLRHVGSTARAQGARAFTGPNNRADGTARAAAMSRVEDAILFWLVQAHCAGFIELPTNYDLMTTLVQLARRPRGWEFADPADVSVENGNRSELRAATVCVSEQILLGIRTALGAYGMPFTQKIQIAMDAAGRAVTRGSPVAWQYTQAPDVPPLYDLLHAILPFRVMTFDVALHDASWTWGRLTGVRPQQIVAMLVTNRGVRASSIRRWGAVLNWVRWHNSHEPGAHGGLFICSLEGGLVGFHTHNARFRDAGGRTWAGLRAPVAFHVEWWLDYMERHAAGQAGYEALPDLATMHKIVATLHALDGSAVTSWHVSDVHAREERPAPRDVHPATASASDGAVDADGHPAGVQWDPNYIKFCSGMRSVDDMPAISMDDPERNPVNVKFDAHCALAGVQYATEVMWRMPVPPKVGTKPTDKYEYGHVLAYFPDLIVKATGAAPSGPGAHPPQCPKRRRQRRYRF
jgi:hypothetical protein